MHRNPSGHTSAKVLLSVVLLVAVRPAAVGAQKPAPTVDVKITLAGDSIVNRRLPTISRMPSGGASRLEVAAYRRYHLSDINRLPNYRAHERIRGI
jgi:hypothetical protein